MGAGDAVVGDASDVADARRIADFAAERMGGIDLLLYAAGYGVLQPIEQTDPDVWGDIDRVNVVGANLIAAAALRHMHIDSICAFLSSRTVEDTNALFAPYAASKAALDHCVRTWRIEHPERRFVRVVAATATGSRSTNPLGSMDDVHDRPSPISE